MIGDIVSALIGAGGSFLNSKVTNAQNKKIMQNQIQWRVNDAKAAGIHPLAALGANMQPVPSQPVLGDAALSGLSEMGKKAFPDPEAERQARANTRLTEANAALAEAQSRTIARAARQPAGATIGTMSGSGQHRPGQPIGAGSFGTIRTDPRVSGAQTIEDRYGNPWDAIWGATVVAPHDLGTTNDRKRYLDRRRNFATMRRRGYYRPTYIPSMGY